MDQVQELTREENLRETEIHFMSSGTSVQMNGFFLSLCSPVIHKMLCGRFREGIYRRIEVHDVTSNSFFRVLDLWFGENIGIKGPLDAMHLAEIAERFQMTEVVAVLETIVLEQLSVETCWEVLASSSRVGLHRAEAAARKMALAHFEDMAATPSFLAMDEAVLASLIDDDALRVSSEEAVLEAVASWIAAQSPDAPRSGANLLRRLRHPLIVPGFLSAPARRIHFRSQGIADSGGMQGMVPAAPPTPPNPAAPAAAWPGPGPLGKEYRPRCGSDLWRGGLNLCGDGGGRAVGRHGKDVTAVTLCQGRACSGAADGSIRVWGRTGGRAEPALERAWDSGSAVGALAAWRGRLVSGHADGTLRVWAVLSGVREQVLDGHAGRVAALAVCGARLASGSADGMIRLWAAAAAAAVGAGEVWVCVGVLTGHTRGVFALVAWRGALASGSGDGTVRVWDVEAGDERALAQCGSAVLALAARGGRLYSAACDGDVREWSGGADGAPLRAGARAEAPAGPVQGLREDRRLACLAVSGQELLGGTDGSLCTDGQHSAAGGDELRVWSTEGLESVCAPLPVLSGGIRCLLALDGEVWAGVGCQVVVWSRQQRCG